MESAVPVNLDYAASTPLRPEALAAQRAYDASPIAGANPNSLHTLGRQAAARLEQCRRRVAASLGAGVRPSEVIFTGGGTEANIMALHGLARAAREADPCRQRVVVSAIEHDSVLDNLPVLRQEGFTCELAPVGRDGVVDIEAFGALMGPDVALVSIMLANNETGAIQPVRELSRIAHEYGARFHTDAIQGWLHVPFNVRDLGVDALSLAGHKVGGPVGCGALYLDHRAVLRPRSFGGGQERGLRPGTQDLRALVALAAAADALAPHVAAEAQRLRALSDGLYERLCASPRIHPSVPGWRDAARLPGIVSIYVDGMDSEELILQLDGRGFEVSAASACSSGSLDASHVLRAMGIPREDALGSLRISFDDRIDSAVLDRFAEALLEVVA